MAIEQIPMAPVYAALVGGAVSFIGAAGITSWTQRSTQKREARQLAKAFKGELSAILSILTARNYQEGLRNSAERCKADQKVHVYSVNAREEYRTVYKENASKLGCLPGTLPEQIAIFYTQSASLLEDFRSSVEISDGKRNVSLLGSPDQAAQRYIKLAKHIDDLISKAQLAIADIDSRYPA